MRKNTKFGKIFNVTMNKRTKQVSFNLRSKEMKRVGLTPLQILEMTIPKTEQKFFKVKNK